MSGAWCLYDLLDRRRKLIRRFPAAAAAESLHRVIDREHRRHPVRLFHEPSGEDWERIGGRWRQRAAAAEVAAAELSAPPPDRSDK